MSSRPPSRSGTRASRCCPITYDGSSVLATQLIEGAPADVFASADERNMAKVVDAGLAVAPVDFATNVLTIAVEPGNPLGIDALDDLADGATETAGGLPITVVLCAPEVPCGSAAQIALHRSGHHRDARERGAERDRPCSPR